MPAPDVHPLLGDPRLRTGIDGASRAYAMAAGHDYALRRVCRDYGRLWLSRMCRQGIEPVNPTHAQSAKGLVVADVLALNERYRAVMLEELPGRIADALALATRYGLLAPESAWAPSAPGVLDARTPDPSTW